ncbi:MAG: DUF4349 domain-containing protein [Defluviitaleaceae bacterium]|nr:DUF4349 domain-containing protein [Defluviitaleaceae bacterium]
MKPKSKRTIGLIAAVILLLAAFAACRSDDSASASDWAPAAAEEPYFVLPMTGGSGGFDLQRRENVITETAYSLHVSDEAIDATDRVEWEDIAGQGRRHIIQTADIEVETDIFDDVVADLRQLAPAVGGYIESEMLTARYNRMFTIVLRVPAAYFYDVLKAVEAMGEVRVVNQRAQDVTAQFYDMVGSLELRRIEEERLLTLIEGTTDIHELLALEQRLTSTRLNIEMYLAQLNNLAGLVSFSTITVTLFDMSEMERYVPVPETIGQRIGGAFGDSFDSTVRATQNVIVFLAGAIIPIVLLILVGFVAFKVTRRIIHSGKFRKISLKSAD